MLFNVQEHKDYFVVQHNSEVLSKENLESGYHQLLESVEQTSLNIGICDFSSIKKISASDNEIRGIIDALTYIYRINKQFHLIVVAKDTAVFNMAKQVHLQIKDKLGFKNIYLTQDMTPAMDLLQEIKSR